MLPEHLFELEKARYGALHHGWSYTAESEDVVTEAHRLALRR
jgi:hypothetical protein